MKKVDTFIAHVIHNAIGRTIKISVCCGPLLPVFGVTVSVTFHLMCVHIVFSSVWVAEWPSFGKELLTRFTICSLCILNICNFISHIGF